MQRLRLASCLLALALGGCSSDTIGNNDASTDATFADAVSDVGDGGSTDAPAPGCAFNGSVVEPCAACSAGTCCIGADGGGCNASCAAPSLWWCFGPADCDGSIGNICCLSAATIGKDCPHALGQTSTSCSFSCNGPRVCVADGDCPSNQHCQTAVEGPVTAGICE